MPNKHPNLNVKEESRRLELPEAKLPVLHPVYFGQCAEDYIVLSMLRALGVREKFDFGRQKYIEIGANHPVSTSATYLLHIGLGMSGVLVEANPQLIPNLKRVRPKDTIVNAAVTASNASSIDFFISDHSELSSVSASFIESFQHSNASVKEKISVPAQNINALMKQYFQDEPPLFVSIDVEGLDADLVDEFDLHACRPFLVQVETNRDWDPLGFARITKKFTSSGYVALCQTDVNLIVVDSRRIGASGSSLDVVNRNYENVAPLKTVQLSGLALSELISTVDVLSLDVFDTILIRRCVEPTDVFGYIEKKTKVLGFQRERIKAEAEARVLFRKGNGSETSLDEIYEVLAESLRMPANAKDIELSAEVNFLYPNPDILKLISIARGLGKRVIAISDIYLSSAQLDSLLKANGVVVDRIYSSSDHREHDRGKYNKEMYRYVCETEGLPPSAFLHVGDNFVSDCKHAKDSGFKAIHIRKLPGVAQAESSHFSRFHPLNSNSTVGTIFGVLAERMLREDLRSLSQAEQFGYEVAGPLLVGFVKHIVTRAQKRRISRLLLLARDGVIVQKTLDLLRPSGLSWKVVPSSRRLTVFPLFHEGDVSKISSLFENLEASLSPEELLQKLSLGGVLSFSGSCSGSQTVTGSIELLKDKLIEQARSEREALLGFLKPELDARSAGREFAWVDVGWALTSVSALNQIIGESAPGFFVGSHQNADPNKDFSGYLFERGDPVDVCDAVMGGVELIELIFSDSAPSTAFLSFKSGEFVQHKQDKQSLEQLRDVFVQDVQRGALQFVADIADLFGGLDSEELRDYNRRVFHDISVAPDFDLYSLVSQIPHDRLPGASIWKTIGDFWMPSRFYMAATSPVPSGHAPRSDRNLVKRMYLKLEFHLLAGLSKLSPPLPTKMTRRFSRSAQKRAKRLLV